MSAGDINVILNLWAASLAIHDDEPPFLTAARIYDTIDTIALGDVAWESFSLQYQVGAPHCAELFDSRKFQSLG